MNVSSDIEPVGFDYTGIPIDTLRHVMLGVPQFLELLSKARLAEYLMSLPEGCLLSRNEHGWFASRWHSLVGFTGVTPAIAIDALLTYERANDGSGGENNG